MQDAIATAEVLFSLGQSEAQAVAADFSSTKARTEFAGSLCTAILAALWRKSATARGCQWAVREPVMAPQKRFSGLVDRVSGALAVLPKTRAGFLAGQLYTALIPDSLR